MICSACLPSTTSQQYKSITVHTRQLINSHIHGIISVKFDGARTNESFDIFFVDKSNDKTKYLIEMITSQLRSDKVWDQFVSFIYNVTTNWPLWIIRIYEEPCNYRLLEEESDWAIIYKVRHRSHKYCPNFFDKCSHFTLKMESNIAILSRNW